MSQHKDEAVRALGQVLERLRGKEPVEGLARFQMTANVEYALGELGQVVEVKRIRRAVPERPANPGSEPSAPPA